MATTRSATPTFTKFFKYEFTGKMESWGKGLSCSDPAKEANWAGFPELGYAIGASDFDPAAYTNSTCTLTEITDATELANCKAAINFA